MSILALGRVVVAATSLVAVAACGGDATDGAGEAEVETVAFDESTRSQAQSLLDGAADALAATPTATFAGQVALTDVAAADRLEIAGRFDLAAGTAEVAAQMLGADGEASDLVRRYVGEDAYSRSAEATECWLHQSRVGSAERIPFVAMLEEAMALGLVEGEETRLVAEVPVDEALAAVVFTGVTQSYDDVSQDLRLEVEITVEDGRYSALSFDSRALMATLEDDGYDPDLAVPVTMEARTLGAFEVTYSTPGETMAVERPDDAFVHDLDTDRPATAPECRDIA